MAELLMTYTGRRVDLFAPEYGSIDLTDIVVPLTRIVRYNGHSTVPITVAWHTAMLLQVIELLRPDATDRGILQMAALVHDMPEAYMGDHICLMKDKTAFVGHRHPPAHEDLGEVVESIETVEKRLLTAILNGLGMTYHWPTGAAQAVALHVEESEDLAHCHDVLQRVELVCFMGFTLDDVLYEAAPEVMDDVRKLVDSGLLLDGAGDGADPDLLFGTFRMVNAELVQSIE